MKAESNVKKHGVRFEEAIEVFNDALHLSMADDACDEEERWITLGQSKKSLCLVVHTFVLHQGNHVNIRIISARRASKHERRQYEE